MNPAAAPDAHTGACMYLLHMLLQRLDRAAPGLVEQMLDGARADRSAFRQQPAPDAAAAQVFDEAIAMLERVHAHQQMALRD